MDNFNFIVNCKTQEELIVVLEKAESEGYKWFSGENPTGFTLYAPMYIHIHPDNRYLLYGEEITLGEKLFVVSADKYLNGEDTISKDMAVSEISQEVKDQIVKEFLEKWIKMSDCSAPSRVCANCVFYSKHTKCKKSLCLVQCYKKINAKELIQIVNCGEVFFKSKKESEMTTTKAITVLENMRTVGVENISSEAMPNFLEALNLAIEVLEEKEDAENAD